MTREEAEQTLIAAGGTEDDAFPLIGAAFACALHENPDRSPVAAQALVDRAVGRLEDRLAQEPPQQAMADTMADDLRLMGDTITYDHPDNADIIAVCERRRGLPVALGVIYIDVARRCGLVVRGLDFPGHFLLRIETDEGPLAIDPFTGGQPVPPSELTRRARLTGLAPEVANQPELLLTPVSDRAVLTRLQNNILTRANHAEDYERADRAALRRALLNPADDHFWLDVAAARERQGALAGALQALSRAQNLRGAAASVAKAARDRLRSQLN